METFGPQIYQLSEIHVTAKTKTNKTKTTTKKQTSKTTTKNR